MTETNQRFSRLDEGRIVYQSDWLAVREYRVERDGVGSLYSIVDRPDAVVVAPLTPSHRTVLLKQFRFPTNQSSWELPMGAMDEAEGPEAAARREVMEEVGLRDVHLIKLGEYRPAPGLTPQRAHVFVARVTEADLDRSLTAWSSSEEIEQVSIVRANDLGDMILDGRITDGFSLAGICLLRLWPDGPERRLP